MGIDLVLLRADREATRAMWSYSGFNAFRRRLCEEIGIDLGEMRGFGGTRAWANVLDDIVPLLDHSDSGGCLGYTDCVKVEPRLRAIVADWLDQDYDKQEALNLCAMMREVVAEDAEAVLFQ